MHIQLRQSVILLRNIKI